MSAPPSPPDDKNALLKYWPILVAAAAFLVQTGVFQNKITEQDSSIKDLKVYSDNTYATVKKLENRVDVHDVKLAYQSETNVQLVNSVKDLTASTTDLKITIEGLKAQLANENKNHDKR